MSNMSDSDRRSTVSKYRTVRGSGHFPQNYRLLCPKYDVKLHPVTNTQFSTIEVLLAMPMTRWEFRIVPCLAGGNASATCLKMLVMRFADVQ